MKHNNFSNFILRTNCFHSLKKIHPQLGTKNCTFFIDLNKGESFQIDQFIGII